MSERLITHARATPMFDLGFLRLHLTSASSKLRHTVHLFDIALRYSDRTDAPITAAAAPR